MKSTIEALKTRIRIARKNTIRERRNILAIPENLLKFNSHILLQHVINQNNLLNDILTTDEYLTIFNNNIALINYTIETEVGRNNYNYFISGSKAWYNIFKDLYDYNVLSDYEKSAIHNSTCNISYYIKTDNIDYLTDILRGFEYELNTIYNIILEIDDKIIFDKKNKIKYDIRTFNFKLKQDDDIENIIISIEINYTNKDIFDNIILNLDKITNNTNFIATSESRDPLKYLNVYGLYIHNERTKHYSKSRYNIFKIREFIYEKYILIQEYKIDTLRKIELLYMDIFDHVKSSILFDENILSNIQKKIILSNDTISTFINNKEIEIIEILRPYINQTIVNINNEIHKKKIDTGIFIAGGDAIRRYGNGLSVTKDIDAKIYLTYCENNENINKYKGKIEKAQEAQIENEDDEDDKKNKIKKYKNKINAIIDLKIKNDKEAIIEIIFNNIISLISFLILEKQKLFTNKNISNTVDEGSINYNVDFSYYDDEYTNFRFRKLKQPNFPVELFSGDYQTKIIYTKKNLSNNSNDFTITSFFNIAFLDIALEILKDVNYNYYNDNVAISKNDIPIASLKFLLNDLIKTYSSDDSSLLRFVGGKIQKDYIRFNDLKSLSNSKKIRTNAGDKKLIIDDETSDQLSNRNILDNIKDYITDNISSNKKLEKKHKCLISYFSSEYKKRDNINKDKIQFMYNINDNIKKCIDTDDKRKLVDVDNISSKKIKSSPSPAQVPSLVSSRGRPLKPKKVDGGTIDEITIDEKDKKIIKKIEPLLIGDNKNIVHVEQLKRELLVKLGITRITFND
jgi:hypothetical protein